MNAPMNALAVLDEAMSWLPYDGDDNRIRERAEQARGAFAALIEVSRRAIPYLREAGDPYEDDGSNEPLEIARALEDSLAGIGGAA